MNCTPAPLGITPSIQDALCIPAVVALPSCTQISILVISLKTLHVWILPTHPPPAPTPASPLWWGILALSQLPRHARLSLLTRPLRWELVSLILQISVHVLFLQESLL